MIDETHDLALTSWVESANDPAADFPIQNLPLGRFRRPGEARYRIGVAIGDQIVDVAHAGLLHTDDMNEFMRAGPAARRTLRTTLSRRLRARKRRCSSLRASLVAQSEVEMGLPCRIGDYTDFYTSIHHATSVGSSSVPTTRSCPTTSGCPSATTGARRRSASAARRFAARAASSRRPTPRRRSSVPPADSTTSSRSGSSWRSATRKASLSPSPRPNRISCGLTLFNDWTARDVQAWEYQPLGPFLSKNFASTVSPWIVTMEALAPFRAPFDARGGRSRAAALSRQRREPQERRGRSHARSVDLDRRHARVGLAPQRLMQSNFRDSYWTMAQLVAHHTVNGCNLQPGDLMGSGTQSGPAAGQGGSMLELSEGGKQPLRLAERADEELPRRRRHGDPARPLRARGLSPDRLRRLRGHHRARHRHRLGMLAPAQRCREARRAERPAARAGLDDRPGLGSLFRRRARRVEDAVRAPDEAPARPRVRRVRRRHAGVADRRGPDPGFPPPVRRADEDDGLANRGGARPRARRGVLRASRPSPLSRRPFHPQGRTSSTTSRSPTSSTTCSGTSRCS